MRKITNLILLRQFELDNGKYRVFIKKFLGIQSPMFESSLFIFI